MTHPHEIQRGRLVLFAAAGCVVLWLLLEGIALAYAWLGGGMKLRGWQTYYQPHAYRNYTPVPGAEALEVGESINNQGFRGHPLPIPKPPGTIRIACMGGSTTYSMRATTNTHTYPARLEALLNAAFAKTGPRVDVLNAGVNTYESLQVLIYLQTRILDFNPDIVLIQSGINDGVLIAGSNEFSTDYRHVRGWFGPPPPRAWEYSPLLSLVLRRSASAGNPYWPNDALGMEPFIWKQGAIGKPTPEQVNQRAHSDRTAPHLRNIRSMLAVARGNGAIPVLLTLPYNPDEPFLAETVAVINRRLRELSHSEDVLLVDLAEEMPWDATSYFDACHMHDTPQGLGRKAKIVFDFFRRNLLIEQAAARANP